MLVDLIVDPVVWVFGALVVVLASVLITTVRFIRREDALRHRRCVREDKSSSSSCVSVTPPSTPAVDDAALARKRGSERRQQEYPFTPKSSSPPPSSVASRRGLSQSALSRTSSPSVPRCSFSALGSQDDSWSTLQGLTFSQFEQKFLSPPSAVSKKSLLSSGLESGSVKKRRMVGMDRATTWSPATGNEATTVSRTPLRWTSSVTLPVTSASTAYSSPSARQKMVLAAPSPQDEKSVDEFLRSSSMTAGMRRRVETRVQSELAAILKAARPSPGLYGLVEDDDDDESSEGDEFAAVADGHSGKSASMKMVSSVEDDETSGEMDSGLDRVRGLLLKWTLEIDSENRRSASAKRLRDHQARVTRKEEQRRIRGMLELAMREQENVFREEEEKDVGQVASLEAPIRVSPADEQEVAQYDMALKEELARRKQLVDRVVDKYLEQAAEAERRRQEDERRRKEEEERKRQAEAAEKARQEAEAKAKREAQEAAEKAKREAEAKAKAEAETSKVKGQQPQSQQQQPPQQQPQQQAGKPASASIAQNVKARATQLAELLKSIDEDCKRIKSNAALAQPLRQLRSDISVCVDSISNSRAKVVEQTNKLVHVQQFSEQNGVISMFFYEVVDGILESVLSASGNRTLLFAYATVCVQVTLRDPKRRLLDVLLARLQSVSPICIPVDIRKFGSESEDEWRARVGVSGSPGDWESLSEWIERQGLYASFLAALCDVGGQNEFGVRAAWSWLAQELNYPIAKRVDAANCRLLCTACFMENAGFAIRSAYPRQYEKIMALIRDDILPKYRAMEGIKPANVSRLEEVAEKTAEPEGRQLSQSSGNADALGA